jgi:nucleolar protein 4
MGLRWLNGHAVDYKIKSGDAPKSKKKAQELQEDKRKRLIVEFAIENANVVNRRSDREEKSRDHKPKEEADADAETGATDGKKRKRDEGKDKVNHKAKKGSGAPDGGPAPAAAAGKDEKLAQRTRIIAKKRQARKAKRVGK